MQKRGGHSNPQVRKGGLELPMRFRFYTTEVREVCMRFVNAPGCCKSAPFRTEHVHVLPSLHSAHCECAAWLTPHALCCIPDRHVRLAQFQYAPFLCRVSAVSGLLHSMPLTHKVMLVAVGCQLLSSDLYNAHTCCSVRVSENPLSRGDVCKYRLQKSALLSSSVPGRQTTDSRKAAHAFACLLGFPPWLYRKGGFTNDRKSLSTPRRIPPVWPSLHRNRGNGDQARDNTIWEERESAVLLRAQRGAILLHAGHSDVSHQTKLAIKAASVSQKLPLAWIFPLRRKNPQHPSVCVREMLALRCWYNCKCLFSS